MIQSRIVLMMVMPLWAAGVLRAEEWPEFRGPGGSGHSAAKGLAVEWGEAKNVDWKVEVAGRGWSSPSVVDDLVWLTTAVETGAAGNGKALRLLAFDKETGRKKHDVAVFELEDAGKQHKKNSYASPTPLVDGPLVFVHFGTLGTAAVDRRTGAVKWKTTLPAVEHVHGNGGSPVVWRDLLIVSCDGVDVQYVVALEKATGKVRWKKDRPKGNMAFSAPLVIEVNGKAQLVSPSAHRTISYDPATGEPLWFVEYGDGFSNVPRPVFAHGLVYLCTGFYKPEILAVKPDGRGDVTASHVVWRAGRGVPLTPSPIVVGDEIYFVSDNGILSCLDAKTGTPHWQERLGGNYSASPLYADGRIYWPGEDGVTTVIAPGKEFRKLASNTVDGMAYASLAVSGRSIYLRSSTHLYRISQAGR